MDRLNSAISVLKWIGYRNLLFLGGGGTLFALQAWQARKVVNPSLLFRKRQPQNVFEPI